MRLKVQPNARRNDVKGAEVDAEGRAFLKVSVTAAPEDGKANAAVIKLLAKRWNVAAGRFTVASGRASRQKVVVVAKADRALIDHINDIEKAGIGQAASREDIG